MDDTLPERRQLLVKRQMPISAIRRRYPTLFEENQVGANKGVPIDQLQVVGIYHFLKAHNFPEFLGYVI